MVPRGIVMRQKKGITSLLIELVKLLVKLVMIRNDDDNPHQRDRVSKMALARVSCVAFGARPVSPR